MFSGLLASAGCNEPPSRVANANSAANLNSNSAGASNSNTAAVPSPSQITKNPNEWAVTLPVLDAFLSDETFATELKSKLQLTDEHVTRLRAISHEATAKLREAGRETAESYSSAAEHRQQAERGIGEVIGRDKVSPLFALVANRWNGDDATAAGTTPSPAPAPPAGAAAVGVPSDTRIVVNAPAFRMDVFESGRLIKSYKIGIGYPEFPLPTGVRKASTIIFNPTWTPPDEPWVESPGGKVEVGKTIKAGDKLNPLGALKIPIGLPSLIHGGKSPAKIGNFASHGCVGLTDSQAKDFAKLLARLGGAELTDEQVASYIENRSETKTVKLTHPGPVELRYETITVEDGKLHIYRDVYDRDTNTEENLRAALEAYGVTLDQLSPAERKQVMTGLTQMARDASGKLDGPARPASGKASGPNANPTGKVTRVIKGQKEVVVEIAALKGKGYPAPVDLDTGSTVKTRKSESNTKPKRRR
jgi:lipoprotein-anchoring transpeptidase ErfK/SrfK